MAAVLRGCAAVALAGVALGATQGGSTNEGRWCRFVDQNPGFVQWNNISNLLSGHELDLVAFHEPPWTRYDPTKPEGWGPGKRLSGYEVDLMIEVARHGNFTIRSYRHRAVLPNESWTDALISVKEEVDLVAGGGWADSSVRRRLGASFTTAIGNLGITLAMPRPQEEVAEFWDNAFFFVKPFHGLAYPIILGCCFVPALCIWFIERRRGPGIEDLANTVFMGFLNVFAVGDFTISRSWFARAAQVLWAFVCLVLVSSYTASLTNFLVVSSRPDVDVDGVSDFFAQGKVACLPQGFGLVQLVRNKWGKDYDSQLHEVPASQMAKSVMDGRCDGMLMHQDYLKSILNGGPPRTPPPEGAVEYGCGLELVGIPDITVVGAFPAGTTQCRWFVIQVIDSLLRDLDEDGVLADKFDAAIEAATLQPDGSPRCPPVPPEPTSSAAVQISPKHLIGLIVTTFPIMVAATLAGLVHEKVTKKEQRGSVHALPHAGLDTALLRSASARFMAAGRQSFRSQGQSGTQAADTDTPGCDHAKAGPAGPQASGSATEMTQEG